MMKKLTKFALVAAVAALAFTSASAAPCSGDLIVWTTFTGNTGTGTCSAGGLDFHSFQIEGTPTVYTMITGSGDITTGGDGTVFINFTFGLIPSSVPSGKVGDFTFSYIVESSAKAGKLISGIDIDISNVLATDPNFAVIERAWACLDAACTTLGESIIIGATAGDPTDAAFFSQGYDRVLIKKDVTVGGSGAQFSDGLVNSHHVPEPTALLLLGTGLLGVGLLVRRRG